MREVHGQGRDFPKSFPALHPRTIANRAPPCWQDAETDSPSPRGRVALLGIAQRTIHVRFTVKPRKSSGSKPLPINIKSIGDLIQAERQAKNLTPGHLASKMGIAASVICSWEDGNAHPDDWQLKLLAKILGFDPKNFEAGTITDTAPHPA